jgi:hypothetical protein
MRRSDEKMTDKPMEIHLTALMDILYEIGNTLVNETPAKANRKAISKLAILESDIRQRIIEGGTVWYSNQQKES